MHCVNKRICTHPTELLVVLPGLVSAELMVPESAARVCSLRLKVKATNSKTNNSTVNQYVLEKQWQRRNAERRFRIQPKEMKTASERENCTVRQADAVQCPVKENALSSRNGNRGTVGILLIC